MNNISLDSEGEQLRGFSPEPNHPEGATAQDQGEHQTDIEECWSDAVIKCCHKNKLHQRPLTVHPQILQFLVRKQQTVLNKILQAKNFCFEKQNSVKCMTIVYLNEPTAEDFDMEFENICHCITTSCENFDSQVVQIQTAAWPFVYRKFCHYMKTYLEDGSIQVIQKDENKYVVGYVNVVEKTASVLKRLSGECVVEKIENMELFEILRMEMILQSQYKHVEIQVQRELFQLMIIGEGEKVKKCIQCYHRLSDLKNLRRKSRQISKSLHKFLALRKMKQGINDLLKENHFHVYWRTRRADSSCVLECFGVAEDVVTNAIEFLTMKGIQEIKIKRKILQAGTLNVHEENAEVFEEDDGNFVVVYFGDIVPKVLAKDSGDSHSNIFTGTYQLRSEQAELLQRKVVRDFINVKLQRLPFTRKWSIDNTNQMIIHCMKKEEADGLRGALQELIYTVQIDVNSSNEHIKQFMSKHQERAAIGKGDDEDCSVICVTVDIKEELDSLRKEMAREITCNPGVSKRHQQKKKFLPFDAEILNHLKENQIDKLTTVYQPCGVQISFTQGGLLLESESEEAISCARKQLFDIVKNIAHREESIKIKRDISNGILKKEMKKIETNRQCSISLFRSEVEEPQYYKSWSNQCMNVVIAEGDIENSVSDVLVCLIDENFEPVGRSAERIFQKVGWFEMNNAARLCKGEDNLRVGTTSSDLKVFLSSTVATQKCRRILYVCSKELRKDMEVVWNSFCHDVGKSRWRSICFPVEDSQIRDGSVEKLLSTISTKKLKNMLEVMLCIPKSNPSSRSDLENICQKNLKCFNSIAFFNEGQNRSDSSDICLQSPIDTKIKVASILDVANEGMTHFEEDLQQTREEFEEKGSDFVTNEISKESSGTDIAQKDAVYGFLANSEKLKLFLTCEKCKEGFDNDRKQPLLLPCLNAVCKQCVSHVWASHNTSFECQICQCVHICYENGNIILPHDGTRRAVLEISRLLSGESSIICEMCTNDRLASHRCFDCSYFICLDCTKLHSSLRTLKCHSYTSMENLLEREMGSLSMFSDITYCPTSGHEKEMMKMFCHTESCMKPVCMICAISAHRNHIICDIAEVANEKRKKIQKLKESVQQIEKQSQVSLSQLTEMSETNISESEGIQKEIAACFSKAKRMLDQRKDELCNAVAHQQCDKEALIGMEKTRLSKFVESCLQACLYVDIAPRINKHPSLYSISKSMEVRLEDLQSQSTGCQVTVDTMKFIPKELDLTFERAAASFGKLMVTKAISLKSKALIKPSLCYVGQESTFQIILVSSLGDMIHDEEVQVYLNFKGENFKIIQCVFEKVSSSFVGNWIPDMPMELSWKVVSNDIEMETLKGVLQIKESCASGNETALSVQVATGITSFQKSANKETKEKILRKAQDAGCRVMQGDCSLSAVKDETSSLNSTKYIVRIPMSKRDFKVFSFFGNRCEWFKKWGKSIHYEDQNLICAVSADDLEGTSIEETMKKLLNEILMMNNDHIEMKNSKGISAEQVMQEVSKTYPDVCLVQKDDIIEIVCNNYSDLLQVKALLQQKVSGKVKRRAGHKFAKTESESEKKEARASDGVVYRRFTDSTYKSERENQTMSLPMVKVKTDEGLVIKIYVGSITHLEVDCIVNAANEQLCHEGGVAAAISEAAGFKFDEESKDYIAKNGPISVGSCGVTSAGRLPYKCVIHTVGPRWGDYRNKNQCLDDLCESVEVTFREADRLRMRSIALPAISSGIFAVPRDQCIQQYHRAVVTFSRNYPFQNLQEIHFVDRDSSMIGAIQEIFKQRRSPANQKAQLTDDEKFSSIYKKDQLNEQSSSTDSIINVSDGFLIKLHVGNIADAVTDVIVCPQDEYCSSNGQIAQAIFGTPVDEVRSSHRKKEKFGDILSQNVSGNSPWKMIIHAVTPRWTGESAKNPQNYKNTVNIMIQEILKTADDAKFSSIAIPLLGAGVGDYQTPVETCARNFYKAVKTTHSELINLKEIQLVLKDETAEKAYLDIFEDGGFQIIPKTGQSMSTKDWGKTIKGSNLSKEQENCCICMDLPKKKKRLQKCGHIFCKDCIEQYFEYKPACPSCGEFYGKVMGDQPPGSISVKKDYHRLEGFNDCSNCIIVTYTFIHGSQGPEHPNPGRQYKGIVRSGYVPNNERGRLVAKLLNVAFSRRLVFTIGRSRVTGQDGVITWNDIHHKTRPTGGPERFGYPDNTYLDRVLEELAAKGVTPDSADDPLEYSEYSKFIKYYG